MMEMEPSRIMILLVGLVSFFENQIQLITFHNYPIQMTSYPVQTKLPSTKKLFDPIPVYTSKSRNRNATKIEYPACL